MSPSKIIHAVERRELLDFQSFDHMKTKSLIWYGLSLICLIIALIIFMKSLDWKALVILAFGVAAVLLLRQGIVESRKK
jgi:hypothetical protein